MKNNYRPNFKIGYLGGGQLAQMLAQSAVNMGLVPHILSPRKEDPATRVGYWQKGDLDNLKDLENFLKKMDVTGFESEFLQAPLLMEAAKNTGARIFPSPCLMGLLQDRQSQKQLLDGYGLKTAPWISANRVDFAFDSISTKPETRKQGVKGKILKTSLSAKPENKKGMEAESMEGFIKKQNYPVVFKKRFFGYDGYGIFIIKNKSSLLSFLKRHWKKDLFILEKFIPFKKECAVILARSQDGSFTHLPFVESFQKQARCDWVKGPVKIRGEKIILKKLKNFLEKTGYVGVMGLEFFLTEKGGLVVNEIAPRVHNTGHYSLDTEGASQFDLHNRCLLGLELPKKIKIKSSFAMANLIGEGGAVKLKAVEGLYWYGKEENRRGRKMGHINATAKSPNRALELVLKRRADLQL